jgi:chemotaxis protein methyltransferase CheR
MLESRLNKRLRSLNISDYKSYIAHVKANPGERQELTNRVTTNETYFYRTPRVWSHFTDEFIPGFLARKTGRPLRVWSAAASSGEEAHTCGVFLEESRLHTPGLEYSILGTDISTKVLAIANEGLYVGRPVARFQASLPEIFARHMRGDDTAGWKVTPQIKARIRFQQHNLLKPLTNTASFDVIFLRNVLIYFTNADQETILRNIARMLHPEGVLYIGESESLKHIDTEFEQVAPIIYRLLRHPGAAHT